jgi:hypothetical protein
MRSLGHTSKRLAIFPRHARMMDARARLSDSYSYKAGQVAQQQPIFLALLGMTIHLSKNGNEHVLASHTFSL